MTKPTVTIGVCVRNGEHLIEEAIESVVRQDYPHELMEVIFVDDGSEDKTLSIMKDYAPRMDMRVEIFRHEWKGLGPSRNVVVDNANGKYIIWVDCDMRLDRDYVRKQVDFMDSSPDVGIGKGCYGIYNTTSMVAYLENMAAVVEFIGRGQETILKPLGTGGSIYRVEALREVGGFDDKITGVGEDMDVEFRVRKAGWALKITDATFYEMRRKDWRALLNEYYWHGSGGHQVFRRKEIPRSVLHKAFPPAAILIECLLSCNAYRLVRRKVVFLLPLHWILKRIAWCIGFAASYGKRSTPLSNSSQVFSC